MEVMQPAYDLRQVSVELLEPEEVDPLPTRIVEVHPTDVSTLGDDTYAEQDLLSPPRVGTAQLALSTLHQSTTAPQHVYLVSPQGDDVEDLPSLGNYKDTPEQGEPLLLHEWRGRKRFIWFALICGPLLMGTISGLAYGLVHSQKNTDSLESDPSLIGTGGADETPDNNLFAPSSHPSPAPFRTVPEESSQFPTSMNPSSVEGGGVDDDGSPTNTPTSNTPTIPSPPSTSTPTPTSGTDAPSDQPVRPMAPPSKETPSLSPIRRPTFAPNPSPVSIVVPVRPPTTSPTAVVVQPTSTPMMTPRPMPDDTMSPIGMPSRATLPPPILSPTPPPPPSASPTRSPTLAPTIQPVPPPPTPWPTQNPSLQPQLPPPPPVMVPISTPTLTPTTTTTIISMDDGGGTETARPTTEVSPSTTTTVAPTLGIIVPDLRFESWNNLTWTTQSWAGQAGYTEQAWNRPGQVNPVEWVLYSEIANEFEDTTLMALHRLGFTNPDSWDCWVNHYDGESWEGLIQRGKVHSFQALGWTLELWTSEDPDQWPDTEFLQWYELSRGQRMAAEDLCYTQELWHGISLEDWDGIKVAEVDFLGLLQRRAHSSSLAFVLGDMDSAQHRAFLWLTGNRLYRDYSEDRRIQRWVLAVLAMSLSDSPRKLPSWVERQDECGSTTTTTATTTTTQQVGGPTTCNAEGLIEDIVLRSAGLQGTLPLELALLAKSLKRIDVAGNNIYGTIPTQLGALSLLQHLHLNTNLLEYTIPTEFGQLGNLTVLNLSQNLLNGTVPLQLENLGGLEEVHLERNGLTGTVPTTLCTSPKFDEIHIDCDKVVCACCFHC